MEVFYGKGVSGGCCIGTAAILRSNRPAVKNERAANPEDEWQRYLAARAQASQALEELYQSMRASAGEDHAEIFSVHAMMMEDEDFHHTVERAIREQHCNAAYAVSLAAKSLSEAFSRMESEYMRERAADVRDVAERLIHLLQHSDEPTTVSARKQPYILCADDLSPAETARLDRSMVIGFVTARGSLTSHTAILARALGIPALVGLGEQAIAAIRDGDLIAIDSAQECLFVHPDASTAARLQAQQVAYSAAAEKLQDWRGRQTKTADGRAFPLYANVGTAQELDAALAVGAEGIGLLRSEFLYLDRQTPPDEEEQLCSYRRVLERMGNRPVIIRTLDVGADKQLPCLPHTPQEDNPALGCRAVRYSLTHPEIFLTQARALLRAGAYGSLSVMFPLISSTDELSQLLALWQQAKQQLHERGLPLLKEIPIGIMIETPAAALISDTLAGMVDFFSIGTNDLTQYTLAMDRQNGALLPFLQPHHPAVLSLIRTTVQNANQAGIWAGVCGELGADTKLTEQLLQMGVRELSVAPTALLALREHISHLHSTPANNTNNEKELSHATKKPCHS